MREKTMMTDQARSPALAPMFLMAVVLLLEPPTVSGQDLDATVEALNAFAAAHLSEVQKLSFTDGVEYCGLFGRDASGGLVATTARRGLADSCEPPEDTPRGFEVLASYHTHGSYDPDADSEVPSLNDLEADIDEGIDGYIATPGGRLWLNDMAEEVSYQVCGLGCVTPDPKFRECQADRPRTVYSLEDLEDRENSPAPDC